MQSSILAPHALSLVLKDVDQAPYSIACDASNKGNCKLYPVVIRFFNADKGTTSSIIDFYEDSDETSAAIAENMIKCIKKVDLDPNNLVSYGADNCSVNYGKNKSVFVNLKNTLNLSELVAGHCQMHILHNTAKFALRMLSYDVESFVIKVFNEFSSSAKKLAHFKQIFEFLDVEYTTLLRHVPTRFCTLFPAVDRLLLDWPAVKTYFLEQGKDNVNPLIWMFLSQESAAEDNLHQLSNVLSLPEIYLYFVHNIMGLITKYINIVQSNHVQITEVYTIFENLRSEIAARKEKQFYGFKIQQSLSKLSPGDRMKFIDDAQDVYNRVLQYLTKWFDFSDTSFYKLCTPFNLNEELEFTDAVMVAEKLGVKFDGDQLFSEICLLNTVVQELKNNQKTVEPGPSTSSSTDQRSQEINPKRADLLWVKFFKKTKAPNLLRIVQTIFAVPPSNAFVERIFSVMKNIWQDERNRLKVEMVKAELMVMFNYNITCSEFEEFLRTDAGKLLVKNVKSESKYNFKKK